MESRKNSEKIATETLRKVTGLPLSGRERTDGAIRTLQFWFDDIALQEGLIFSVHAEGLHRHRITVSAGNRSQLLMGQILSSDSGQIERYADHLAILSKRGFTEIRSFALDQKSITEMLGDTLATWEKEKVDRHTSDEAMFDTVVLDLPFLLLGFSELIGIEEEEATSDQVGELEGVLSTQIVNKRERSPKNRLLCLEYHGDKCVICGFESTKKYPHLSSVIEVHHIQPVSSLSAPRHFNPKTDLIPLCPNCHRAIHAKRPTPYTPEELLQIVSD